LFRHGFEQSCSAMATQKLEEKVLQHDEDADLSKSGCNGLLQPALMCSCNGLLQAIEGTWHDKAHACTHVSQLCPPHLVRTKHQTCAGGYFAHSEHPSPQKYFGNKSEIAEFHHFTTPPP